MREVVADLPEEVRQEDEKRDHAGEHEPPVEHERAISRQQQGHNDGEPEDEHGVLVQQSDTSKESEEQPEPRIASLHESNDDERTGAPDQRLDRVHAEIAAEGEI